MSAALAQRFRALYKTSGLGKLALCKAIGITNETFDSLLAGRTTPQRKTLVKVARYFQVDPDTLLPTPSSPPPTADLPADSVELTHGSATLPQSISTEGGSTTVESSLTVIRIALGKLPRAEAEALAWELAKEAVRATEQPTPEALPVGFKRGAGP